VARPAAEPAAVRPAAEPAAVRSWLRTAQACLELTKPRIVLLILFTGLPALLMAARGFPPAGVFWATLIGTALAAASGSAFNHYVDRDIDRLMRRTARRPLPAGVLTPAQALGLGAGLGALSWLILATWTNLLAAGLALLSIVYYAVIYSAWLKRRTPQNIVIGGGAGSSAPLIAWAAVTGGIELPAVVLACVVFLWTPPHFWALSLYRRDDYLRARLPMLPVTHGEAETRRQILIYSVALVPVTLLPVLLRVAGAFYAVPALLLGLAFVHDAARLCRTAAVADAVHLFRYSILYLFLLFALLTLDVGLRAWGGGWS
jgi:protoheme IX farnesyltransferase